MTADTGVRVGEPATSKKIAVSKSVGTSASAALVFVRVTMSLPPELTKTADADLDPFVKPIVSDPADAGSPTTREEVLSILRVVSLRMSLF